MRLSALRDRDLAQIILRRVDRVTGAINPFLIAISVGLAMLDLIYAVQNLVDSLPMAVQISAHTP